MTPLRARGGDQLTDRNNYSPKKSVMKSKLSIGGSTLKTANFLELE